MIWIPSSRSRDFNCRVYHTAEGWFLEKVTKEFVDHNKPPELVINMYDTGLAVVPVSNWTLADKGSKDVSVTGIDDRQITVVVSCTPKGVLLAPQVLY